MPLIYLDSGPGRVVTHARIANSQPIASPYGMARPPTLLVLLTNTSASVARPHPIGDRMVIMT